MLFETLIWSPYLMSIYTKVSANSLHDLGDSTSVYGVAGCLQQSVHSRGLFCCFA